MSVGPNSRHILCIGVSRVTDGLTFLLDREPIRFIPRPDNRRVIATDSDTWHSLAAEHFPSIPNGEELYWVIADFQPEPIIDPTVMPVPGTIIYIPSEEFVMSEYFSDARREDYEI